MTGISKIDFAINNLNSRKEIIEGWMISEAMGTYPVTGRLNSNLSDLLIINHTIQYLKRMRICRAGYQEISEENAVQENYLSAILEDLDEGTSKTYERAAALQSEKD